MKKTKLQVGIYKDESTGIYYDTLNGEVVTSFAVESDNDHITFLINNKRYEVDEVNPREFKYITNTACRHCGRDYE